MAGMTPAESAYRQRLSWAMTGGAALPSEATWGSGRLLYCSDLNRILPGRCCDSCHDDFNGWGFDPSEAWHRGRLFHVCCDRLRQVEDECPAP